MPGTDWSTTNVGTGPGVITPDGCAVDFYALVPAGPEPGIVAAAAGPAPALILELGAGAGRITEALAAMGHRVVAVDESADMLARIQTAETIRAPIQDLALGRQFIQQHPPTWFDSVTPAEREEGGSSSGCGACPGPSPGWCRQRLS